MNESETARALNKAFDETQITFHNRSETLAAFREGHDVVIDDETGVVTTTYDGETVTLTTALTRFAFDNRDHVDGRTLPKEGAGRNRPGTLSKSTMTLQEKMDYIAQHGADAYGRLPITSVSSSEVKTKADFFRLPTSEKVRLTASDPNYLAKLPNAPTTNPVESRMEALHGGRTKVNYAALEKQRRIRPTG